MKTVEKRVRVIPYEIHLICECGAEMQYTGMILTVYPPRYVHRCPSCGEKDDKPTQQYPYVIYEEPVDTAR